MAIILENLRIENCEITVDVGDTEDSGKNGELSFEYSINDARKVQGPKTVGLNYPAGSESIPITPKTGLKIIVLAKLVVDGKSKTIQRLLTFCG